MNLSSCLMVGLEGESITPSEKEFLVSYPPAGVILFKRNIKSFKQVYELCKEIQSLKKGKPFLIGTDREGGRVDRFSHLEESALYPSAESLAKLSEDQVFFVAQTLGKELQTLGIHINFAPVVDFPYKESQLLRTRTFSFDPMQIVLKSSAFCKGLRSQGVLPCLKHFPGHGNVTEDSHEVLPQDKRSLKELEHQLSIFKKVLKKSSSSLVMTSHIQFPNVDSEVATFSNKILQNLLRKQLNYKGVIVSDDIDMKALDSFSPGERVFLSLKAGCNLILSCQHRKTVEDIFSFFKTQVEKEKELKPFLKNSSLLLHSLSLPPSPSDWGEADRILKNLKSQELMISLFKKEFK